MFREKLGVLFRYYRKRYNNIQKLMNTDEHHRFFDAGENQPVCCIRTVYYIEQGLHNNDDDVLIFLIQKFGYEYYQDETLDDMLENLIEQSIQFIKTLKFNELLNLEKKIAQMRLQRKFLYHVQYELIESVVDLYCHNSLQKGIAFIGKDYPVSCLYKNGFQLEQILRLHYYTYYSKDYFNATQLLKQKPIVHNLDLQLCYIGQICNNYLYQNALIKFVEILEEQSSEIRNHYIQKINWINKNREVVETKINQAIVNRTIEKQDTYGCILLLKELLKSNNHTTQKYCQLIINALTK